MTCDELEQDTRPIPLFFYEDICNNLPNCANDNLYPVNDQTYSVLQRGDEDEEIVVQSSSDFIDQNPRCTYSYTLRNANGGQVQNYYEITQ